MAVQIIAMGGGGFSMDTPDNAMDRYVIAQTGKTAPKVAFLGQASGEALSYFEKFHTAFDAMGCEHTHLSLFSHPNDEGYKYNADVEGYLLSQDIIYVGGGSTRSMLAVWREWGLDVILRKAAAGGTILAGISAGAICWFTQGLTDSIYNQLNTLNCLGYLPGSATPHYDGEPNRRPTYMSKVAAGAIQPGYALCDYAAVHFVDGKLLRCVSTKDEARVFYVSREGDKAVETPLDMTHL
jgi:dipeptidase E